MSGVVCPWCGRRASRVTCALNAPTLYEPCGHSAADFLSIQPPAQRWPVVAEVARRALEATR